MRARYVDCLCCQLRLDGVVPIHVVIALTGGFLWLHCLDHPALSRRWKTPLQRASHDAGTITRDHRASALAGVRFEPGLADCLLEV